MTLRVVLSLFALLWGVQFLVFRAWWTRFLTATNWSDAPDWLAPTMPYVGFGVGIVWSIMLLSTGFFGVY